jgi:hypothetical protein
MSNTETVPHFVQFDLDVKPWIDAPPDLPTARPPRCVVCNAPGINASGRIVLHGHGLRERGLLGPGEVGDKPMVRRLLLRRYECQCCKAVITVGPRGLLPGRRYSATAVAVALWFWAVRMLTDPEVRKRTSPNEDQSLSRPERWTTLRRWARAAREGRLWSSASIAPEWSLRDCANRAARLIWSRGRPDSSTDEARVFHGAGLAH